MAEITLTGIQECLVEMQVSDLNEFDILMNHFSEEEIIEILNLAAEAVVLRTNVDCATIAPEKNKVQAINVADDYQR